MADANMCARSVSSCFSNVRQQVSFQSSGFRVNQYFLNIRYLGLFFSIMFDLSVYSVPLVPP